MKVFEMDEMEYQKDMQEIKKLNAETTKLFQEARFYKKRNRYFEFMLLVAVFAAGGAFVKFLG